MLAHICLKEGPGIPLVFLHGFLGCSVDWKPVCDLLPPCHCIGVDLPGHGQSPFTPHFEITLEKFHLIGYSMGGRLALEYASKHPQKVASLTLASVHPGLTNETEKEQRLASDAAWSQLLLQLPIEEFLTRWYAQPLFRHFKPDWKRRIEQKVAGLAAALNHYSLGKQPFYKVSDVLVGEFDEKFRNLHTHPIVIPSAGHAVHLENPKAVAFEIKKRVYLHDVRVFEVENRT
jgi:2-succinyl-6-hydroxy-2,4-cyclohexadiene-1-carboxylate synthase